MTILMQVALHNAALLAMFCVAWYSGRSLGSWPTYISAIVAMVAAQIYCSFNAPNRSATLASSIDIMLAPTLLFVMARAQRIAGLRRGQMNEAERMRWIARHGLAASGGRRMAEQRQARNHGKAARPLATMAYRPTV